MNSLGQERSRCRLLCDVRIDMDPTPSPGMVIAKGRCRFLSSIRPLLLQIEKAPLWKGADLDQRENYIRPATDAWGGDGILRRGKRADCNTRSRCGCGGACADSDRSYLECRHH